MIVIGLTGGIGMGKTTVASQLAALGAKICSADAIVHALLAHDKTLIERIQKNFPGAVANSVVDRKQLGALVFADPEKRKALEMLLHPKVIAVENRFIARMQRLGVRYVVLDIPLLFETQGEQRCHLSLVASAPPFIQKQRVMKRPGMSEQKFAAILRAQMSDQEKRKRADYVIPTGLGRANSFKAVKMILCHAR